MIRRVVRRCGIRSAAIRVAPLALLVLACGSEPDSPDPETVCQAFALSRCMSIAATECGASAGATSQELTTCPQFVSCRETHLEECAARMADSNH